MSKMSLKDELLQAGKNGYAVGAFNVFNYTTAKAVIDAAEEFKTPVILQTSTSTVRQFGPEELGRMLKVLADNSSVNVIVHLDHCTVPELAKRCIDLGWDSVMIDGSRLPLKDNIRVTREITEYAHRKNVSVEGELGAIEGVEDDIASEKSGSVNYEDCIVFINDTGIDALAPSIGTAHGVYKGRPVINFDLIRKLRAGISCPLVIHGGTGLEEETFRELIKSGASKINVSTAIKHAYLDGCKGYFERCPSTIDPLGFDGYVASKVRAEVKRHIDIFRLVERA